MSRESLISGLACSGGNNFGSYLQDAVVQQRLRNYHKLDHWAQGELIGDLMSACHGEIQHALQVGLTHPEATETKAPISPSDAVGGDHKKPAAGSVYPAQFTHAAGPNWPGTQCGLNTVALKLQVDIWGKHVDCPACLLGKPW